MRPEEAVAAATVAVGVRVAGTVGTATAAATTVQHVNAPAKVLILQEMFDQRALLRRVQDRWENWRKHDAATFIRVCMI